MTVKASVSKIGMGKHESFVSECCKPSGMGKHEVKKNSGNKGKGEVSGGEDVMENTLFEVVKENAALNV